MARPIRPNDLFILEAVGDIALSPSGDTVVFTIGWPDEASDENRSRLWLHDLGTGETRQLSEGHRDSQPVFSPNGSAVAFLRAEPKEAAQLAVLDVEAGDVRVFEIGDGVADLAWIDENRLSVLATQRPADQLGLDDDEVQRRPRVIDSLDYRFNGRGWIHDRKRRVAVIDTSTSLDAGGAWLESASLDLGSQDCAAMAHSGPDARDPAVLAILPDPDAELTGGNRVWLLDDNGGPATALTPAGGAWHAVGWTTDHRPFATGSTDITRVSFDQPHLLDPSGQTSPKPLGSDDVNCTALLGGSAKPTAIDGAIICPGIRGGTISIDRYDLESGQTTVLAAVRGMAGSFAINRDGSRLFAAVSTPRRPAELWDCSAMATGAEPTTVVALNEDLLSELDLSEPEVISVASSDGTLVEAFVCHPPASAPDTGALRPALVYVHGGPMSIYGLNFFDEFQLAAAVGYVVVGSNPRGSDGYGIDFARAVVGDMGGPDWADVSAVADHLASLDTVDPDRIGMGGGSYGGFMTSWAIGHTNRFAAALVERCVSNWETFIGTSDIGSWFGPRCCDATIESDVDSIRRQSPVTYAANNTTPTLIVHSEEDWRCPPEQAEQLFAAYRRAGVPTRFVRFPGENHELTRAGKPRHRVERFDLVHDFFAEHLGGGRFVR